VRPRARSAVVAAVALAGALCLRPSPDPAPQEGALPQLGTELGQFPPGPMKAVADQACLNCHSADLVRQQRLNEKQWTAEVNKMIGWGAAVPEDQKDALVAYLLEHFGPDNDRFQPVIAQPAKR
jgi:quinoprotein glucose dehydrogenase